MPGIIRKFAIIAAAEGLILQPYSSWTIQNDNNAHNALHIEYKTCKIAPWKSLPLKSYQKSSVLESHGVIGLLSVASYSYLISINRREQVAQIFGKPIYVITDISLLPLSSKGEAEEEIASIHASNRKLQANENQSDTDVSGDEPELDLDDKGGFSDDDVSTPPEQDHQLGKPNNTIDEKKAKSEDTSSRQYDQFAASWLSKRGWNLSLTSAQQNRSQADNASQESLHPIQTSATNPANEHQDSAREARKNGSMMLRPKLLRTTKMLLSSRNFFYSYDLNITRRFGHADQKFAEEPSGEALETMFFWNRHLVDPFLTKASESYIIPVMQGYVGQKVFMARSSPPSSSQQNTAVESLERLLTPNGKTDLDDSKKQQSFLLTIISRRSIDRAGLRYTRRGIDDNGNVANFCETEQIFSSPTWDATIQPRAFLQIRGSIPLYFSQSPYSFKPLPITHHSQAVNEKAFTEHFRKLSRRYNRIQVTSLVDKHGSEAKIGDEFQLYAERLRNSSDFFRSSLVFDWFDFHGECRGMKFENVSRLVEKMASTLSAFGENVISLSGDNNITLVSSQNGCFRVNCMDCLDRTNVVQSAFGQYMLERALQSEGFEIDFHLDTSTQWFNNLWADNGDALSRQYASTAALKGDFTRTRKRNYRGMMNDFGLTLSRYYSNTVNDYFSQTVIDFLLGNATEATLDDFEANMMNGDPGISINKIRQNAIQTCEKLVVQDPEEELKNGWIMLSPSQPNTLRALPLEEVVILLTGTALYSCRFDWSTEKLASFERIDLRSIVKLVWGTYITSTLTEKQRDEEGNIGLVISYRAGKDTITRVNTRSLQSEVEPPSQNNSVSLPRRTSGVPWLSGRDSSPPTQMMALKATAVGKSQAFNEPSNAVSDVQSVCEEIQRVKLGDSVQTLDAKDSLIEHAAIISLTEAEQRTGYLEKLGYQIKRFVWA